MNYQKFLNIVGLLFNIIGVILIWRYGLPADINREGHVILVLEGKDEKEKSLAHKYDIMSRIGMFLLILGFVCQFIALFFD